MKGCKVLNFTQNILKYSDDTGYFEISAAIGDSVAISSMFHKTLKFKVDSSHFSDENVFELTAVVNQLDEVLITETTEKEYNNVEFNKNLKSIIAEDIKKNPHLYGNNAAQYGLDFVYLYQLVAKLFKKKKTYEEPALEYSNLTELFNNSTLFNENLLVEGMGISKEHKFLFLEYCSIRRIDSSLARKEREIELLDTLMVRSFEFKKLLGQSVKKD
jgi:hypothetical protein